MKKNKKTPQTLLATEQEKQDISSLAVEDEQSEHLIVLRKIALHWMERLASFNPYLIGEVLDGAATEYADISLQVFCDDTKELAIFLLDAGVQYQVNETPPTRFTYASKYCSETLSFLWPSANHEEAVGIHIEAYDLDDLRRLPRSDAQGRPLRMNQQKLVALIKGGESNEAESADGSTNAASAA